VVEGVGDHGCEYMTGGAVVVLGQTGRNFGAGMSGGIAFVLDEEKRFESRCNLSLVELEPVDEDADEELLRTLLARHAVLTGSERAAQLLDDWPASVRRFVKVMPVEYRRVLGQRERSEHTSREMTPRGRPERILEVRAERAPAAAGRAADPDVARVLRAAPG
jgi:glutamate synthase (ferredoxin)